MVFLIDFVFVSAIITRVKSRVVIDVLLRTIIDGLIETDHKYSVGMR